MRLLTVLCVGAAALSSVGTATAVPGRVAPGVTVSDAAPLVEKTRGAVRFYYGYGYPGFYPAYYWPQPRFYSRYYYHPRVVHRPRAIYRSRVVHYPRIYYRPWWGYRYW